MWTWEARSRLSFVVRKPLCRAKERDRSNAEESDPIPAAMLPVADELIEWVYVRYWHKADIWPLSFNVCLWG